MPLVTPVNTPDEEPMVAVAVLLLLQLPPVVALPSVVVAPSHTGVDPVMADGEGFTVTVRVADALPQLFVTV